MRERGKWIYISGGRYNVNSKWAVKLRMHSAIPKDKKNNASLKSQQIKWNPKKYSGNKRRQERRR